MDVLSIANRFPTQESCIEHLETVRFGEDPFCPRCGVIGSCARKTEANYQGRWNCHACKSTFNVLTGTIFQGTHIRLQKWFAAISLILNAKKSLSSCQLARDLSLNQKTAWYMQQRIRAEMAKKQGMLLLEGIIEADETYVGGKPRKPNRRKDDKPSKRGRGTKKTPVIGAVKRGGKVVAQVADDLTGRGIMKFIKNSVNVEDSELITDEYKPYNVINSVMTHRQIDHKKAFSENGIHTNTIEGFWSLLKRAWYGSHHHYTKQYTPLFVAEATYKYNAREDEQAFRTFLNGCFV